ncbi:MAG: DUF4280 domain-containing protein, partial [Bacteroidales bacterium]|nr:DUF4280 domain-containing protein [Bacteroidales bacterium]
MGKQYVVQTAICMCKFGAAPGILKVTDNKGVYMNGKLTATTLTLGNVFNPPGFGVCKINPIMPKPCTPTVTQWTDYYDGISINGSSYPLTESSKGTCAMGCPGCITFQMTGQIPIPGLPQMKQAAAEHQTKMNPMGFAEALDENAEDNIPTIIDAYWLDEKGSKHREFMVEQPVTLYVQLHSYNAGETVNLTFEDSD